LSEVVIMPTSTGINDIQPTVESATENAKSLDHPSILPTSELLRPEEILKDHEAFRDYTKDDLLGARVSKTYHLMHLGQTMEFVRRKQAKWLKFNHFEAPVMEAMDKLNKLVDESDPDLDLPNIVHAYQTAERIRKDHPDKEWLHLVGFIHDLGKVMAFYQEPQWAVVGDTFPVGCKPQPSIVYGEKSFLGNLDMEDERYNTRLGIYKEGCGIENLTMSWGHDEYLYHVLKNHMKKVGDKAKGKIEDGGLWAIRYHSFYPWHTGRDYSYFESEKDKEIMDWVLEFNKYDLYTKSTEIPDMEKLRPYYEGLANKYLPGKISF